MMVMAVSKRRQRQKKKTSSRTTAVVLVGAAILSLLIALSSSLRHGAHGFASPADLSSSSSCRRRLQHHTQNADGRTTVALRSTTRNTPAAVLTTAAAQAQAQQPVDDDTDTAVGTGTGTGQASISALTVNLIKSIVGSGVLALPASVAVLGNTPNVLLPASIIILAMCLLNAYFFTLIGRVCAWTGATGYRDAWDKTVGASAAASVSSAASTTSLTSSTTSDSDDTNTRNSNNNNSSRLVAGVIVIKTGLSCLAYSMILADSFQSLAQSAGMLDVTRNEALHAVTAIALVPLCLLRNISSLTPFSLLGLAGILFTVLSMMYRYLDGSYSTTSLLEPPDIECIQSTAVPLDGVAAAMAAGPVSTLISFNDGGAGLGESITAALTESASTMCSTATTFLASAAIPPPPTEVMLSPDGIAVLVCTLATAFVAHYNAPRFFNELSNNTTPRFNSVVAMAYTISALVFIIVSVTGFLTFGSISDGLILNNYSTQDSLMTLSRAAVALSLVFTYPLPFVGLRDGVLALAREFWVKDDNNHNINNDNAEESSSTSTTTTGSAAATTATCMVKAKEEEKANGNDNSDDSFAVTTIISLVLLGAVTLGAESISDLKLVLAVGGGTFSTAVASVFPALMFRSAMLQKHKLQDDNNNNDRMILLAADDTSNTMADNTSAAATQRRQWESLEIKFVTALMGLSITIGATGVYRALESAMNQ